MLNPKPITAQANPEPCRGGQDCPNTTGKEVNLKSRRKDHTWAHNTHSHFPLSPGQSHLSLCLQWLCICTHLVDFKIYLSHNHNPPGLQISTPDLNTFIVFLETNFLFIHLLFYILLLSWFSVVKCNDSAFVYIVKWSQ